MFIYIYIYIYINMCVYVLKKSGQDPCSAPSFWFLSTSRFSSTCASSDLHSELAMRAQCSGFRLDP